MTFGYIIIYGILGFFAGCCIIMVWQSQRLYNFRRELKAGDSCKAFIGEDRFECIVLARGEFRARLKVIIDGREITRPINEIYN